MERKYLMPIAIMLCISLSSACLTQTQENAAQTISSNTNLTYSTVASLVNDSACQGNSNRHAIDILDNRTAENNKTVHQLDKRVADNNKTIHDVSSRLSKRTDQLNTTIDEHFNRSVLQKESYNESDEIKSMREQLENFEVQMNDQFRSVRNNYVEFSTYNESISDVNDTLQSEMSQYKLDVNDEISRTQETVQQNTRIMGLPSSVFILAASIIIVGLYSVHVMGVETVKSKLPYFEGEVEEHTLEELTTDSSLKNRVEKVRDLKKCVVDGEDDTVETDKMTDEEKAELFRRIEEGRIQNEDDLESDAEIIINMGADALGEGVDTKDEQA